jgi:hypothetical protein
MNRTPYDYPWQTLRRDHLRQNPDCVRCGKPGQEVDHIESVRSAPDRRLDPYNLRTLCKSCHSRETNAHDHPRLSPHRGAALSGAPLDPEHPWHGDPAAGEMHTTDLKRWQKGRPIRQRRER